MLDRLRRHTRASRRASADLDLDALRLNFSLVLHERSDSPVVSDHVQTAARHVARVGALQADELSGTPPIGFEELVDLAPGAILTATLGLPRVTQLLAHRCPGAPGLIAIDRFSAPYTEAEFFRAPAALALPALPVDRLAVAAALLRPGGKSIEVVTHGPFAWPSDQEAALRAVEDLIRDYLPQWHPPRPLWPGPVEELLPEFRSGGAIGPSSAK